MGTNGKTTQIAIDGKLLKKAFQDRKITMNEAAKNLGCGCAISNAINRNRISKPLIIALSSEYGITLDEITPKKEKPVPEKPASGPWCETCEFIVTPQISREQWDILEKTIEMAVLQVAVKLIETWTKEGDA